MNKKSLVVQSNSLVEAKYRLSVEEQKIIKILISQIKRDDKDFHNYEFHIKDLAALLGMEHTNPYGVLREITKKLISRVLEFYNPETKTILQVSWLASAEYRQGQGTVSMSFHPSLKPLLLQLQSYFTKYELGQVLQFKGQYTIRFFELRKSFLGKRKKEAIFSLKELWELFKLERNEYKQFFDFKKRVLEPARLELLEKTGQSFSWEAVRQGKGGKVVGVRFVFDEEVEEKNEEEKETVAILENKPQQKTENQLVPEKPKPEEKPIIEPEKNEAVSLLMDCGISENVVAQLTDGRETDYIREKIAIAESHPEYVKNKAGFVIQAIKENWVDADVMRMRQEEARRSAQNEALEHRKRLKDIWDRYKVQRNSLGLKEYQKKPVDEIHRLKSEFLGTLKDIFRSIYTKKEDFGYEDGLFRSFFLNTLELPSFDRFLVLEGITLSSEEREILEREIIR